ncbi:universal stress protein PHOS32-like [Rutidosis leptorrhynchoides]|uniref:universal stress protein PHOS32-like n=1 Tax=Rutidosis leptorrhynchoides TaxID=125765 RepID=UPI003A996449
MTFSVANSGAKAAQRRKIMVVAEPTRESAAALHYVLSHVIFENDILYLLHVENPTFWKNRISCFMKQPSTSTHTIAARESGGCNGGVGGGCIGRNVDFLDHMKNACELVHPKLKVKVAKIESDARDKSCVIISQTKMLGIDLLVVGKRHSLSNAILRQRKNGSILRGDTADYLVEHSICTCVAVQRKGQTGGYLLHTKTHRNFWLLA